MHSAASRVTDTQAKALRINLDPIRCGSFAEIGAGQEVVRWFFRVGGARGTIAYTPEQLPIFSRDVLSKIAHGDPTWEAMVPAGVAATIRERRAFGWRPEHGRSAA